MKKVLISGAAGFIGSHLCETISGVMILESLESITSLPEDLKIFLILKVSKISESLNRMLVNHLN